MAERLIDIVTDGGTGFSLKEFTGGLEFENEGGALIHGIFYGGLAQLATKSFDFDAMISQLLRERTKLCLDQVSNDMRPAITWIKGFIAERERNGEGVPNLLKRYVRGKKSFTSYQLDLNVKLEEMEEMLDFMLRGNW